MLKIAGSSWAIEYREASAELVLERLAKEKSVPDSVKAVIVAAVACLPGRRPDLGVLVSASGHLGSWAEWEAASAEVDGRALSVAKPQGFFSLWVGYTSGGQELRKA